MGYWYLLLANWPIFWNSLLQQFIFACAGISTAIPAVCFLFPRPFCWEFSSPWRGNLGELFALLNRTFSLTQYLINIQLDQAPRGHNFIALIWIPLQLSRLVDNALNTSYSDDFLHRNRGTVYSLRGQGYFFTACRLTLVPISTKAGICFNILLSLRNFNRSEHLRENLSVLMLK